MSINLKTYRKLTNGFARNHHFNFAIIDWRDPSYDSPLLGKLLGSFTSQIQSIFCSSINLPQKSIISERVPIHFGMPGISIAKNVDYAPWTVTFYSDEVNMLRYFFLRWTELIQNTSNQQFALPSRYKSTFAYASILTPQDIPIQVYSFKGLFPTSVGSITVQQQDTSVMQFDVTFAYDFFTVNKDALAFLASLAQEKFIDIFTGNFSTKKINLPGGISIDSPF